MNPPTRVLVAVLIGLASTFGAPTVTVGQEIDGLLEAGREIVPPAAAVDLLAPLGAARFRLGDPDHRGFGWQIATSKDGLDRVGTRVMVRNVRGRAALHAGLSYAEIGGIEEVQDYEATGAEIPVQDVRLRVGVDADLGGGFWVGGDARYLQSELADLRERNITGMVRGGIRTEDFEAAVEGVAVRLSDEDAFHPRVVRGASRLHVWGGFHALAGAGWREREEVYGALGLSWRPRTLEALALDGAAEFDAHGIRTIGAELRIGWDAWSVGLQVRYIGPFARSVGGWVEHR